MEHDFHSQELQLSTSLDIQISKVNFNSFQYIIIQLAINLGQFVIIHVPKDGTLIIMHHFVCYTFFLRVYLEIHFSASLWKYFTTKLQTQYIHIMHCPTWGMITLCHVNILHNQSKTGRHHRWCLKILSQTGPKLFCLLEYLPKDVIPVRQKWIRPYFHLHISWSMLSITQWNL